MTAKTQTITCAAVGLIIVFIAGYFTFVHANKEVVPNVSSSIPKTEVIVSVPDDASDPADVTQNPDITSSNAIDSDYDEKDPENTGTSIPTNEGLPEVENIIEEDLKDKLPEVSSTVTKDKIVGSQKDKNAVETGPASGEDRNDEILKEKENKTLEYEREGDCPIIVEDEKTSTGGSDKGNAIIINEKNNANDSNKNSPEYNPSIGGDNPFNDDAQTLINDKPVEDYIGEGENRPGEGIHF